MGQCEFWLESFQYIEDGRGEGERGRRRERMLYPNPSEWGEEGKGGTRCVRTCPTVTALKAPERPRQCINICVHAWTTALVSADVSGWCRHAWCCVLRLMWASILSLWAGWKPHRPLLQTSVFSQPPWVHELSLHLGQLSSGHTFVLFLGRGEIRS